MTLAERADKLVTELDKRDISPYVSLAKAGLWVATAVLVVAASVALSRGLKGDTGSLGTVVSAMQVLAVIALSVLGWHGYKGNRVFHLLRHMRGDDLEATG